LAMETTRWVIACALAGKNQRQGASGKQDDIGKRISTLQRATGFQPLILLFAGLSDAGTRSPAFFKDELREKS